MRAVRYHGPRDIRVEEVEEPVCEVEEVKIRPAFVGICGSDIHEYLHGPATVPCTPHPITRQQMPVTLGHEFSGTIVEIGKGVTRAKVGDQVAVKPDLFDGGCAACLRGWVNCCRNLGFVGFSGSAGGLSDYVVVKEEQAIQLPEGFPLDLGALVEPLTVAWHVVNRCSTQDARTALVVGAGPIGLAVLLVLKARGMESVVVVETSPERRELASILGATHVLDPQTEDIVAAVRAMTGDAGADVAFECSAAQAGLDTAVKGIRARGTVTIVSLYGEKPVIDALDVVLREKHVVGAVIYEDGDFEAVIEAIWSGQLNPRPLITNKIRMEDIVDKGIKALIGGRDKQVKILVDISLKSEAEGRTVRHDQLRL
ncbi:GroES-like protein [Aspergillus sclerotioniger CBS 115572]|uniref:GroES-like protein n=1 Tax=Aspergillus sclerotioniger CBS 115572 TaxID=1450535 RepID=A0A317VJY9_9EURO|nr:GroES-like protein [Aspergillus sclerotioniger CBS 115572]PWY72220.1 GroES-like protein [Aspergillus sclerotioniger CBS 115572]